MSEGQTVRQRRDVSELPLFHGETYDEERDLGRLTAQRQRVARAMMALDWCGPEDVARKIERMTGKRDPVASVDRQMRYVREWADGPYCLSWTWEERDIGNGAKEHRLVRAE